MRGSDSLREQVAKARRAQQCVVLESSAGLAFALEAGDALNAAKTMVGNGQWSRVLAQCDIAPSTARVFMQLARNRDRITAADCASIVEARRLVAKRGVGRNATTNPYGDGYADGYQPGRAEIGDVALPSERELKWLISLAHPDRHPDGDNANKAIGVTRWLTGLLARTRSANA